LKYDKFFKDQNYVEKQYVIAEPFLNLVSGTPPDEDSQKRITELESKNSELDHTLRTVAKRSEDADKTSRELEGKVTELLRSLPPPERLKEMTENYETLEEFYHATIERQIAEKEGHTKPRREAKKK
jgi:hypothetical protein